MRLISNDYGIGKGGSGLSMTTKGQDALIEFGSSGVSNLSQTAIFSSGSEPMIMAK